MLVVCVCARARVCPASSTPLGPPTARGSEICNGFPPNPLASPALSSVLSVHVVGYPTSYKHSDDERAML